MKKDKDENIQPTPTSKLDLYYKDIFKRYTPEELSFHKKDRFLKSPLELIYAMNYDLMFALEEWQLYCEGKGERPEDSLSSVFTPARTGDNTAKRQLGKICHELAKFKHGSVERIPIFAFACRSTLELIAQLKEFCCTEYIKEAEVVFRQFIDEVVYRGKPLFTQEEFRHFLIEKTNRFIELCAKNAPELDAEIQRRLKAREKAPLQVEVKGTPEVKLDKKTKGELKDIYNASVHGKPPTDKRKMGNVRKQMAEYGADIKGKKDISYLDAAIETIKKFQNCKGGYAKGEERALEKAIERQFKLRK